MAIISKNAIYGWLCFLFSFSIYYYYYHLPLSDTWLLDKVAWLTRLQLDAIYYVISIYAAGWLLDNKPSMRKKLPVHSAIACTFSIVGIGLTTSILQDLFILFFHLSFAPMFVSSLYFMRESISRYFITSLIAIRLIENLIWILIGASRVQSVVIYILFVISLVLFFLMRKLPQNDEQIYGLEVFYEKIRIHWLIVVLFIFQFLYNTQIATVFWANLNFNNNLIALIPVLLMAGILFIIYAVLLDRKGWKFVFLISCSFSALFLLILMIPTSSNVVKMLIPVADVSSIGLEILLLTIPFTFFSNQKGYRLYAIGFILTQLLFEVPGFVTEDLINSSMGRLISSASIVNAFILIGLLIYALYKKEKSRDAEEKQKLKDDLGTRDKMCFEIYGLSNREIQVAELLIQAKNRDEIGLELGLSRGTINTYCSSLYKKTGCNSQVELITKLIQKKSEI